MLWVLTDYSWQIMKKVTFSAPQWLRTAENNGELHTRAHSSLMGFWERIHPNTPKLPLLFYILSDLPWTVENRTVQAEIGIDAEITPSIFYGLLDYMNQ